MACKVRNVTPVDRIGDFEIRKGMVFYTSTVSGEVEERSMRLAAWLEMEDKFAVARREYERGRAKLVSFIRQNGA
jgi:hypothetical protein